jgi:membrane-associated protease RseP (regulator of RpoE activity)
MQTAEALQAELGGLFHVTDVATRSNGRVITFRGQLVNDPDGSYDEIRSRFQAHGYTPMLQHKKGEDEIVALEGLAGSAKTGNPLINVALLLATIVTTLAAGASLSGVNVLAALTSGSTGAIIEAALSGAAFAVALMAILGIHELGHYVAARIHGVKTSLPYFIPVPFGGIGTLGAFISIKSPMRDRRVLFDIGLSGPIAGFLVALPLLFIGLMLSTEQVPFYTRGLTLNRFGSSILIGTIVDVMTDIPVGRTLALHPVFFAAWLGFFLTAINLLPVGQLDGGHTAYALFGRFAHTIAIGAFLFLILAGAFLSTNWFIWAFFIMLGGLRHPPPLNDITDVGFPRKVLGFLAIVLFVLLFTPVPFR